MGGVAHVGAGGRVGGDHAALGGGIGHQQVDAHGAGRVVAVHHGDGGHVKAQGRDEGQRLGRGRLTGFDLGTQVLEQLQQLAAAGRAGRHPDGRQVLDHGHGGLGGCLLCAVHVFVEAFADLLAQHPSGQTLGGDDVGAVARLFVVLVVNGLDDVVRHVQGRQVKQLEGAKPEADLVAQDAVDGGEIGNAFADDAQGFGAIATARVVDDEAGRVLGLHRGVAHLAGVVRQALADGGVGLEAGNHLDHLHEWHRVEEVVPSKAAWVLHAGGNGRHRQGRGVGHQHGIGGKDFFQVGENGFLDLDFFDDGFDHQIAASQVLKGGGVLQACLVAGHSLGAELALVGQFVPGLTQGFTGLGAGAALGVKQPDLAAGLGGDLGDATAHGPGADDGDFGKRKCHAGLSLR